MGNLILPFHHNFCIPIFESTMAPSSTTRSDSPARSSDHTREKSSDKPLWEIVDIPGKGKGIIVTENITPGTLLLSEAWRQPGPVAGCPLRGYRGHGQDDVNVFLC